MSERLSLLTGRMTARPTVAPSSRPTPLDVLTEAVRVLADGQKSTLDYLRMEPEARAKKEAAELLDRANQETAQERTAREAAEANAARIQAEYETALRKQKEAAQQMREIIAAAEDEAARLRADLASRTGEIERLQAEIQAKPMPQPEPQPAPVANTPAALKPEDIQFEYRRHANGLLARVVMKAKGYQDVAIDIERGADNLMRNLRVR